MERAPVDPVLDQRRCGRRVIVYLANIEVRNLTPRARANFEHEGLWVTMRRASTVAPERRKKWLRGGWRRVWFRRDNPHQRAEVRHA
jgi:hypothetical protein